MTKEELSTLLKKVKIPVNEGSSPAGVGFPRLIYHSYEDQDVMASGNEYVQKSLYQVDLYAKTPRCPEYWRLREILREAGLHPIFYHNYVEDDPIFKNTWQTYFSLEVTEEIEELTEIWSNGEKVGVL